MTAPSGGEDALDDRLAWASPSHSDRINQAAPVRDAGWVEITRRMFD